jgi:hypothetical protein
MTKTDKAPGLSKATYYSMAEQTRISLHKSKAVPADWDPKGDPDAAPAEEPETTTTEEEESEQEEAPAAETPAPKAAAKAAPKAAAKAATKAAEPEAMGPADRYMVLVNQTAQKLKGLGVSVEVKYNF